MDIDEIRRQNIAELERRFGAPYLVDKTGMSFAQYYNLRDGARDSKTGKRRGMRKDTARRIEVAGGVAPGWLDTPHNQPTSDNKGPLIEPPEQSFSAPAQALIRRIAECDKSGALSPALVKAIEATIKAVSVAAASEATREKTGGNAEAPAGADKPEATEKAELPDMSKFDDFSHNRKNRNGGTGTNGIS